LGHITTGLTAPRARLPSRPLAHSLTRVNHSPSLMIQSATFPVFRIQRCPRQGISPDHSRGMILGREISCALAGPGWGPPRGAPLPLPPLYRCSDEYSS
jgi:hypothetical protein